MKSLALLLIAAAALGSSDTPVSKVIDLLTGMIQTSKEAKHAEEAEYTKYRRWCLDTNQATQQQITDGNERIGVLTADIAKYQATANELARGIAVHDADVGVWNGDIKAANKVRDLENTDFTAANQNYAESIDALGRAINILQQQNFDRDQAKDALLQVRALAGTEKQIIDSFLAMSNKDINNSLEPAGYEFQSKGVIAMLQKLEQKFRDEVTSLRKTETEAKHAHALLMEDLDAQISEATRARTKKAQAKSNALQSKGAAEGDLADTTATRDEDQNFLQDTSAVCNIKAADFESRETLRREEITALEKAVEILSSDDVKGNAEKHLPKLLQKTSFVQLRSMAKNVHDNQARVAVFLKIKGAKLHSRVLAAMAMRAEADPFVKVRKMIQGLVVRLMEEASNEATEKAWCDEELQGNEKTRKDKTSNVERLHSESDLLKANIAKLGNEIAELQAAVAKLDADVLEATTIRHSEKAENETAIKDAVAAQAAVANALQVLQDFYAKAGEATALVQEPRERPKAPPVFDRPYKGLQAENGGVVGMLEVIQSDFARLESETKASEAQAQKEYDEFVADARENKAQKKKDIEHKVVKKQDEEQQLQETTSDLEGTQSELSAALNEYDKLKQSCLDTGLNYEERVKKRQEEINSLQEALRILRGEDRPQE